MNVSDIVYPAYLTGLKDADGEWFRGGYDIYTQDPGWVRVYLINQLITFNLAEFDWTLVEVGHVVTTDWITLFTFPNGYKIKAWFEQRPGVSGVSTYFQCQTNLFDTDDNVVGTIANIANFGGSMGTYYPIQWGNLRGGDFYLYVALRTQYGTNPVPDQQNDGIFMTMWVGSLSYGFNVTTGQIKIPGNDSGRIGNDITLVQFLDLEGFATYLHSHGNPFDGDPYTTDPIPDDPAGSDDTSEPGGGGGNYDDTSDPIDFPALPQGGALESGSIIAHRVVKQTLEAIFSKLWTKSIFDLDAMWQKSIENPMDAIVSLHALPCSPEVVADPNNIYIGNLDMKVTSPKLTSQYIEVDCGTVTLQEFWGSALDYSPYTRVEIYLPFIGVQTLRTEDVMKTAVHVKYHVDALTGDCIAFIKCGMSVLYTFNGNCKMNIPLSARSTDFLQKVAAAAGLAIGAVGVSVGGGAALAGATKAPQIASATVTATAADMQSDSMAISSAANIASTKINTSRSGDISGGLSLMASFVPYFIIHRPVQSLAKDFNKFKGYTSNITKRLGDLTGFTEVEHINLQGIPNATAAEMAEIKTALKNGVIF